MNNQNRYRLLAVGEIVVKGDEEFVPGSGWCPIGPYYVGKHVLDENCLPVRRAFVRRMAAVSPMDLGKALDIVWRMAAALYRQHGEFSAPAKCPADATAALIVVEDFIVNHFEE